MVLRLRSGGAKGPGLFFVLPCIDAYRCHLMIIVIVIIVMLMITIMITNFFIAIIIFIFRCVDLRTGAFDVPPQEILTRWVPLDNCVVKCPNWHPLDNCAEKVSKLAPLIIDAKKCQNWHPGPHSMTSKVFKLTHPK